MKFYKKIHLHKCQINNAIAFRYTLLHVETQLIASLHATNPKNRMPADTACIDALQNNIFQKKLKSPTEVGIVADRRCRKAEGSKTIFRLHECQINKAIASRYTLLRSDCSNRAVGGVVSERKDFSFVSFSFSHKRK